MRILALEPYYGGSHQAFLDGWAAQSRYEWTLLTLPAHKWKWRMRHAPVTFAEQVAARAAGGEQWDAVFCSDMLDLAAFLGLAGGSIARPPAVAYFHENQLTYPARHDEPRDRHFAFTNFTTALAARAVWFNSAFHRDAFLGALDGFLARMPDHQPLGSVEALRARSEVLPPGIAPLPPRPARPPGPLRILWAARWEYDKGAEAFFEALGLLAGRGVDFRLSVIGQQFRDVPAAFARARRAWAGRIDRWGHQARRADYVSALGEADVFVSTAEHEFFGISAVEAVAAGAYPVLPDRLAYPEVLGAIAGDRAGAFLYDGTPGGLADRLADLAGRRAADALWPGRTDLSRSAQACFGWARAAGRLDDALERTVRPG